MKLRLSYVGVNTDSFPRIQITDTGMQIMASNDSLRAAIHEAQQYLLGLQKIEREFASDSIVEQDRRIDKYLASKKKNPPTQWRVVSPAPIRSHRQTKSTPNLRYNSSV